MSAPLARQLARILCDTVIESGAFVGDDERSLGCVCVDGDIDFLDLGDAVVGHLLDLAGTGRLLAELKRGS